MKKLVNIALTILVSAITLLAGKPADDKEYLGLPGDNLNLFAVMKLFQESETLEAFERELNNPDNMINNLDLNGDDYVDYIKVEHYPDNKVHNIVLRVPLDKNDYQDVAVITVEELRNGEVQVQIIGDEALYGPNYVVEPIYDETPNPGYAVNRSSAKQDSEVQVVTTTYGDVARWPVIVYIYQPSYVVWRSPWSWGYYPDYWKPWTPHYWHFYYGYHYNWYGHYYVHYRPYHHVRCSYYRVNYYTSIRHTSPTVVVNINRGRYKNTYSRPELKADGERLYGHRASMTGGNTSTQRPTRSDESSPRPINTAETDRGVRQQDGANRDAINDRQARETDRGSGAADARPTREEPANRPASRIDETRPEERRGETSTPGKKEIGSDTPVQRPVNEVKRDEPVRQDRSKTTTPSQPSREDRGNSKVRQSEAGRTQRNTPNDSSSGSSTSRSQQQNQPRNSGQSIERSRQSQGSNREVNRPSSTQQQKSIERSNRNSNSSEGSNRSGANRR